MLRKFSFITLLCILCFVTVADAQIIDWKTYTSVGTIRDMAISGETIWGASSGGAVTMQRGDAVLTQITNTEGLSQNDVAAVAIDPNGAIWFGLQNGILNRYQPSTGQWLEIDHYQDEIIYDMHILNDSLFLALDFGVSLFNTLDVEVKDNFQNLGQTGTIKKIAAISIYSHANKLWVATDEGVAVAPLDPGVNLQSPVIWTTYKSQDGLNANKINAISSLKDTIYAATSNGVYKLENSSWTPAGFSQKEVNAIVRLQTPEAVDQLVALVEGSTVALLNTSNTWATITPAQTKITALETGDDGSLWIARQDLGLLEYDFAEKDWQLTEANAPKSSNFNALTIDSKGRLWAASRSVNTLAGGIQMFDGVQWTYFARPELNSNDYRSILEDHEGNIWAGSWGGGVAIIQEVDGVFKFTNLDTTNDVLSPFQPGNYVIAPAIAQDQFNNIWILNSQAINLRRVAVRTPNNEFAYFSVIDGILNTPLTAISPDQRGWVWLGLENRGIQIIKYGGTLFDSSDDNFTSGLVESEGLYSNNITALAEDESGVMWIGTDKGLNLWFASEPDKAFEAPVTAIGIDPVDNKWIGTPNGVTILRAQGEVIADYTIQNSNLVSPNVQAFAFDEKNTYAWIGTDRGLSRSVFPFPRENLAQVTGYPNPFEVNRENKFFINFLTEDATVNIFTASGKHVKKIPPNGSAQVTWNGADSKGSFVASGVYVFVATTVDGNSTTGKVVVIRP